MRRDSWSPSFFQGLAEASTYCGAIYVTGLWYKPGEVAKWNAFFTASGQVGSMLAGVTLTAIYEGMDGHAGLQGWQWVSSMSWLASFSPNPIPPSH
ncbi:Uu.00g024810.m01.CDS01 [Anthostomella pinea]|uniref:Uu.00g024810.m01.CDS01 n=1 Tax=Anthostomella pinea TaxID=933095 RepID=A0AAI8V2E8_9PEZI|nr:Uu.00g024810.m01.CDS01 [Anthostomella pinea]